MSDAITPNPYAPPPGICNSRPKVMHRVSKKPWHVVMTSVSVSC